MPLSLRVDLGRLSYPVHVGSGLLRQTGSVVANHLAGRRVVVISDGNVARLHADPVLDSLRSMGMEAFLELVPAGEGAKTLECYSELQGRLLGRQLGRDGAIVALGGGCVGDLAGFAAATLYRGVRWIQVPTTLLAQVDSSVGGKTGVNAPHGKNLVGAFHQPVCVLADVDVLTTLPKNELRAGYAEMLKAGLLGDRAFANWLAEHGDEILEGTEGARIRGVCDAIAIKAAIVSRDEREDGQRALLNLGHTFAHAFEAEEGQSGALAHGFAVAVGLVLAAECSERMGFCRHGIATEIRQHLRDRGLPLHPGDLAGAPFSPRGLLLRMAHDKKVRAGKSMLVLLREVGDAFLCEEPDWDTVRGVLEETCER